MTLSLSILQTLDFYGIGFLTGAQLVLAAYHLPALWQSIASKRTITKGVTA
jgi:hypothetical protein